MAINILYLIIPGLIAVIGNIIFYSIIKNKIDKSIENYKISYSGIYQKKIEIYQNILRHIYELKVKIQQYQYFGNKLFGDKLIHSFNDFISYYKINKPFINHEIMLRLESITKELQLSFENFYKYKYIAETPDIDSATREKILHAFFETISKFKNDQPFMHIEDRLISEIRKDLKICMF